MTYLAVLDSLGWAVLHSIWQGALAWVAVIAMRRLLPGASPNLKCNLQIGALLATFVAFIATFALYLGISPAAVSPTFVLDLAGTGDGNTAVLTLASGATDATFGQDGSSLWAAWIGSDRLAAATPFIAAVWVAGFLFSALRYGLGFAAAQSLRSKGISAPSQNWLRRFSRLCEQSGVSRSVRLLVSNRVDQPLTLGLFKPVVLVPVGFLTALPADQVEAILRHELGHIRRYDYAINLIQTAVKVVLFYHPAVHAICHYVEMDREEACDDHAIHHGPDTPARNGSVLARGLASLRLIQDQLKAAALRDHSSDGFSMAALGRKSSRPESSPLMRRLSRLAGRADTVRSEPILMSALTALLLGSVYLAAPSGAQAHPHKPSVPSAQKVSPVSPTAPQAPKAELRKTDTKVLAGASPQAAPVPVPSPRPYPTTAPQPPVPPVAIQFSDMDNRKLQAILAKNDKIIAQMNHEISKRVNKLTRLASGPDFDEDAIEALADEIETIADKYEAKLEAQEDLIDAEVERMVADFETNFDAEYGDAYEERMEAWAENFERQWEGKSEWQTQMAERAAEQAERSVEKALHSAEQQIAFREKHEAMKAQQREEHQQRLAAQEQRQAEREQRKAEIVQREAERVQRKMERAQQEAEREQHETQARFAENVKKHETDYKLFQAELTEALMRDGLISNDKSTVRLEQKGTKISVNGRTVPQTLNAKYMTMLDLSDDWSGKTEIKMTPKSFHISKKHGDHRSQTTINY